MLIDFKVALVKKNMTQRQFSRESGYNEVYLSRIITEFYPPSENFKKAAVGVLNIPKEELFPEKSQTNCLQKIAQPGQRRS